MFHETYTLHMQSVMDSERPPQRIVRLISQENEVFEVQEAVAMLSNLVKISLEGESLPKCMRVLFSRSVHAKAPEFRHACLRGWSMVEYGMRRGRRHAAATLTCSNS
jgi:hypothetical protein